MRTLRGKLSRKPGWSPRPATAPNVWLPQVVDLVRAICALMLLKMCAMHPAGEQLSRHLPQAVMRGVIASPIVLFVPLGRHAFPESHKVQFHEIRIMCGTEGYPSLNRPFGFGFLFQNPRFSSGVLH